LVIAKEERSSGENFKERGQRGSIQEKVSVSWGRTDQAEGNGGEEAWVVQDREGGLTEEGRLAIKKGRACCQGFGSSGDVSRKIMVET